MPEDANKPEPRLESSVERGGMATIAKVDAEIDVRELSLVAAVPYGTTQREVRAALDELEHVLAAEPHVNYDDEPEDEPQPVRADGGATLDVSQGTIIHLDGEWHHSTEFDGYEHTTACGLQEDDPSAWQIRLPPANPDGPRCEECFPAVAPDGGFEHVLVSERAFRNARRSVYHDPDPDDPDTPACNRNADGWERKSPAEADRMDFDRCPHCSGDVDYSNDGDPFARRDALLDADPDLATDGGQPITRSDDAAEGGGED